jgi:hypothetical protein
MGNETFAPARNGLALSDCHFYHVMELPGVGLITGGKWDLRSSVDDLFHGADFAGKTVLEIGPASGFLTFEMERRGADVIVVDAAPDHDWDIIPFPGLPERWGKASRKGWIAGTNAWWFAHEKLGSKARAIYCGGENVAIEDTSKRDIAVLANILLHNRDPLKIVTNAANIADQVLIIEQWAPELDQTNLPVMRLNANPKNPDNWNHWWRFSTHVFATHLEVMGFANPVIHRYRLHWGNQPVEYFTLTMKRAS